MALEIVEDVSAADNPARGAGESGRVTADDLAAWIGADASEAQAIAFDFASAEGLVLDHLDDAWRPVPRSFVNRMVLEVGHEIHKRRDSPSGSSQYAVLEQGAGSVRGPRDPLAVVRPDLGRYVLPL